MQVDDGGEMITSVAIAGEVSLAVTQPVSPSAAEVINSIETIKQPKVKGKLATVKDPNRTQTDIEMVAALDESVDESQVTTMQATLKGLILEDSQIKLGVSIASVNEFDDAELNEEADDFMETYLAVNLELKVNEKHHQPNSRTSRNNAKTVSSSK